MRVLITGSSGYVGNVLAVHFARKGIPVLGIDREVCCAGQDQYPDFVFSARDVRDKAGLQRDFATFRPTHVIHLAYLMNPQHDRTFEDDVDINGSRLVFEVAQAEPSVVQFIHFSSASVYGGFPDNEPWITEEQEPRPRDWVYAQNKITVEKLYAKMHARKTLKLVNLRMCTAVGPSYYKKGGVVSVLAKTPVGILLDGKDTEIQFIHENDLCRLVEKVAHDTEVTGTYNLASDSFATTQEMNLRRWKFFLPFPKILFRWIITLLWNLRLSPISPTSVNLVAYGIVISSAKIKDRYGYRFEFTTQAAFFDACAKRLKKGTL